jgi:hypothetical protein
MKPMHSDIDSFDSGSSSSDNEEAVGNGSKTSEESARMDTEEMERLLNQ